jgi:multiple antibiotic resistance protein
MCLKMTYMSALFFADAFQPFLLSFVALFVAIDCIAVVPLYLNITQDLGDAGRSKLLKKALATAGVLALVFLLLGNFIFQLFGITEADFKIGGGIVLLTISVLDLVSSNSDERRGGGEDAGVVPIGIPLIMGPAALTSILVSSKSYGFWITLTSLLVNLLIVWVVFTNSKLIRKAIGDGASKAVGKVASLFLAAIAVAMIRSGVQYFFGQ